ncbi:MAG TPA: hypothetical protein VE263_03760 [Candidatus Angelobacter sp.]|nr:hypothetical protein [Candidatus Angelobacter sp.]
MVAGILVGAIFSVGTDAVFHKAGVFPPWGQSMAGYEGALLLATAYRTIYGLAGAYVTAWLAPYRPMLHAVILGILGLIVSIAGAAGTWNKGPAFGPHSYPAALIVLALPTAWAGGKLRTAQILSHFAS